MEISKIPSLYTRVAAYILLSSVLFNAFQQQKNPFKLKPNSSFFPLPPSNPNTTKQNSKTIGAPDMSCRVPEWLKGMCCGIHKWSRSWKRGNVSQITLFTAPIYSLLCDLLCNFNRKQFKMQLYHLLSARTVVNICLKTYSAFCEISAFLQQAKYTSSNIKFLYHWECT